MWVNKEGKKADLSALAYTSILAFSQHTQTHNYNVDAHKVNKVICPSLYTHTVIHLFSSYVSLSNPFMHCLLVLTLHRQPAFYSLEVKQDMCEKNSRHYHIKTQQASQYSHEHIFMTDLCGPFIILLWDKIEIIHTPTLNWIWLTKKKPFALLLFLNILFCYVPVFPPTLSKLYCRIIIVKLYSKYRGAPITYTQTHSHTLQNKKYCSIVVRTVLSKWVILYLQVMSNYM